jgi:hypothetical protein
MKLYLHRIYGTFLLAATHKASYWPAHYQGAQLRINMHYIKYLFI